MGIDVCLDGANLYVLKSLCVIDVFAYCSVCLDRFVWWTRAVAVVNFAFASMVMLRIMAPDPDLVSADVLYSSSGFGVVVALGYLLRSAVGGFVLTAMVSVFGLAVGWYVAMKNAADVFDKLGMVDSDMTRFLVAGLVIIAVFVVVFIACIGTELVVMCLRVLLFSALFALSVRALVLNDGLMRKTEVCCTDDSDSCPFVVDQRTVWVFMGALFGRLMLVLYDKASVGCFWCRYYCGCCCCSSASQNNNKKTEKDKDSEKRRLLLKQNE